jgi:hypothetical protein
MTPPVTALAAHLAGHLHRHGVDRDTANQCGRDLAWLHTNRFHIRAWWLDTLTAAGLDTTTATELVVGIAHRFGFWLTDLARPACPRCRHPLTLHDVWIPAPTGYCRDCPPTTRHTTTTHPVVSVPLPRTPTATAATVPSEQLELL